MLQAARRATPDVTNARRGKTPFDPTRREQKERGLFNFLTWPFLLVQMFAAEELLTGGPATAAADEERARLANSGQNNGSAAEGDLAAASRSLRGAQEDETSASPETRLDPADRSEMREGRPLPPGEDERWATYKQDTAAGGGGPGGAGGGSESADQAPASGGLPELASEANPSDVGSPGSASALPLLNIGGALPLQTVTSLDPSTVIQSALPMLDSAGPLLTATTEAAGDVIGDTVDTITSALAAVPQTLTGLAEPVSDIAGNVVQTVSSVTDGLAPVLAATTGAATDLVEGTVNGAASILTAVPQTLTALAEPVTDVAGSAIQTVSSVDSVAPVLTGTGDFVADTASSAAPILAAVPQTLAAVTGAAGDVVQGLQSILDGTRPALAGSIDAIDSLSAGALGSAVSIVQAAGATLTSASTLVDNVGDQVLQIGPSTLDRIGTALTATTAGVGEAVDGTAGSVTSVLDGSSSTLATAVESIGDVLSFGEAGDSSSNAAGPELPIVSAEIIIDQLSADLSIRSGGEAFASGGVIAFSSRHAGDDASDDAFSNDTHTPYGLALTINTTEAARSLHAVADLDQGPSSKLPSLTDHGRERDTSQDRGSDLSHSPFGPVADVSSAIDDIGSRAGDLLL
jgi:hypothetical protein